MATNRALMNMGKECDIQSSKQVERQKMWLMYFRNTIPMGNSRESLYVYDRSELKNCFVHLGSESAEVWDGSWGEICSMLGLTDMSLTRDS